jgi:hypothetical protein
VCFVSMVPFYLLTVFSDNRLRFSRSTSLPHTPLPPLARRSRPGRREHGRALTSATRRGPDVADILAQISVRAAHHDTPAPSASSAKGFFLARQLPPASSATHGLAPLLTFSSLGALDASSPSSCAYLATLALHPGALYALFTLRVAL